MAVKAILVIDKLVAKMDVADWLRRLGLEQYEPAFRENHIDPSILPKLDAGDLADLGVRSVGHRRKLIDAIAALRAGDADNGREAAGTDMPAADPAVAQRRQLTVMFCDLVGSSALSARLGPEELREVIGPYHRRCAAIIGRSGGFVARYMGDGLLAYFGYPQAHEDDPERAVRAGLELVASAMTLDDGTGSALHVRVGIATGLAVVGDLLGEGAAREQAVVGDAPNIAARLQALAGPDMVIIDSGTRRLLGELFEYRAIGPVIIKGFGEPLPLWQVTGASAVVSRFAALRATTTPLVGRDEEIDLLMRRWQQAKGGDGSVVLISGEAGIGKSRIAETVLERLGGEAYTRLRFYCSPHHQDSAFYPAMTQFERAAGFRREDTAEQRLDKLEAVLALATGNPREAAPLLAALLSIPTGARYPPLDLSPQKQKDLTLKAFVTQIEGLAARQPVLMVVEDAHWGDPSSRELFDLIIDRVATLQVLVIVTFRPEFTPPWIGRAHVTLLSLNRLRPRQRAEMILRVTRGKALPPEVAEQIIDRTDGVPLFIEELTKAVVESGVLADAGDRWTLVGPLPPLAIPTSLSASLLARLDHLAPVREVAQIGAALGRQFSHELISAVATMPQRQLDDSLSLLVGNELIFRRGIPPHAEYTFKHALVQDAAYSTLLRSTRQQLHSRIIATLEGRFPEIAATQLVDMARHCAEADLVEKAVGYLLRAGRQAIARWALAEAVAQLRKGLDLLIGLPEGETRRELELNLQRALGSALIATKGYSAPEPGEAYARARQLCDQLKRPPELGVLVGQFTFRLVRGELEQAERHADEIRRLGDALGDPRWKHVGATCSGATCSWLGKFSDAQSYLENGVASWDPALRVGASSPEDNYVTMLLHLARTLLCLGHVGEARRRKAEALAEARALSPYTLAYALCQSWDDDWAIDGVKSAHAVLRAAEELVVISREQSFPMWFGFGSIMRGWCLGVTGEAGEGIPLILKGLEICRGTGTNLGMPFVLMALAEVYGMAGQPEVGLARLTEATKRIETTQERWAEAEIHRMRGTLLSSMHDRGGAEDSYRLALAVARSQGARFWELRAAVDLARLLRDQQRGAEARDVLSPLCDWFAEELDAPTVKDASAVLGDLRSIL